MHSRDNRYKEQTWGINRNHDINTLIKAVKNELKDHKIVRFGKGGDPVNKDFANSVVLDSNIGDELSEPVLLSSATLYVGTTSGCGPFVGSVYGIPTLLVNTTGIAYNDMAPRNTVLASKVIVQDDANMRKYCGIGILRLSWSTIGIPTRFREMTDREIADAVRGS